MRDKLTKYFVRSAGVIFLITGAAKVYTAMGDTELLKYEEPVLFLSFRQLFFVSGVIELVLARWCLVKTAPFMVGWIGWMALAITAYRVALWSANWRRPCNCLGSLTDSLRISPAAADMGMKVVLAYLLLVSCVLAVHYWRYPRC